MKLNNVEFTAFVGLDWADAYEVRILHNGEIIGSRHASRNTPSVEVLFPNGGEVLSGDSVTIEWLGKDKDRDDVLSSDVQFSADDGVSWETLVVNYADTTLPFDPKLLSESQSALIRVYVRDGFLAGFDTSDGVFSTPNSPPTVNVLLPFANHVFGGQQTLVMKATSNDVEDEFLMDADLMWSSNIDGFLGEGHDLVVLASALTPGDHEITLAGTDSGDAVGTDMVRIIVVGDEFPPILLANVSADPAILATPNHKMVPVNLEVDIHTLPGYAEPECTIVSVSSNEPDDNLGDGSTSGDWEITGALQVELRAERMGGGSGRVYSIDVECTTLPFDTVRGTALVHVPKDN